MRDSILQVVFCEGSYVYFDGIMGRIVVCVFFIDGFFVFGWEEWCCFDVEGLECELWSGLCEVGVLFVFFDVLIVVLFGVMNEFVFWFVVCLDDVEVC